MAWWGKCKSVRFGAAIDGGLLHWDWYVVIKCSSIPISESRIDEIREWIKTSDRSSRTRIGWSSPPTDLTQTKIFPSFTSNQNFPLYNWTLVGNYNALPLTFYFALFPEISFDLTSIHLRMGYKYLDMRRALGECEKLIRKLFQSPLFKVSFGSTTAN